MSPVTNRVEDKVMNKLMNKNSFATAAAVALLGTSFFAFRPPIAQAQQAPEPDFRYGFGVMYDNIIVSDAAQAVEDCTAMVTALGDDSDKDTRHDAFVTLASAWARAQAVYILGGYEENAVDYPLLIDTYHVGKEDIPAKLDRAIDSDSDPETALFKNSYRTLTALDYLLTGDWSPRRSALSFVAANTVCERLDTLHTGYLAQREAFLDDQQNAMKLMINAVIQSAYKTRDWRIGEVAGLTRKTLGNVLPENAQFPNNLDASWAAIGAIIDTHRRLLTTTDSINIAKLAKGYGRGDLPEVQEALNDAQAAYDSATLEDFTDTEKMIPLYEALKEVQSALYEHVAGSLGVPAGLVDADGD